MAMSSQTTNIGLGKWESTDILQTADVNGNMDIIDAEITALDAKIESAVSGTSVVYTIPASSMISIASGTVYLHYDTVSKVATLFGLITSSSAVSAAWQFITSLSTLTGIPAPVGTFNSPVKLGGYSSSTVGGVEVRSDSGVRIFTTAVSQQIGFNLTFLTE